MAKYQVGVTAFATLDMPAGFAAGTVYLLCEDCGWIKYQATDIHLLKHEHDSSCQAMKWTRERYASSNRATSPVTYDLIPEVPSLKRGGLVFPERSSGAEDLH